MATADGEPAQPLPRRGGDPWVRFVVVFAVLALGSELLYYGWVLGSQSLQAYLHWIASVSGWFIAFFDPSVTVSGSQIGSAFFIVDIAPECDAVQLSALLAAAILAFPASWSARLIGTAVSLIWLQCINFARIVSLYYIGGKFEDYFHTAHEKGWPLLLIAITIATWLVWARYAAPLPPERAAEAKT
jgi:exosortase H (IPTLxxWG-CTERM-specific)